MPHDCVALELFLHRIPRLGIDDRVVLTRMALALVDDLADKDRVRKQLVQMAAGEELAAAASTVVGLAGLRSMTQAVGLFLDPPDTGVLQNRARSHRQGADCVTRKRLRG